MKGIVANCKTGKTREVDDGLPLPVYAPLVQSEGVNLAEVKIKLAEIDEIKTRLEQVEIKINEHEGLH